MQAEIDELALYLGLDDESDCEIDPAEPPTNHERLAPFPTSDSTSPELVALTDCYKLPSYAPLLNSTDRTLPSTAPATPQTWTGPNSEATSPLDAFFQHYFLSSRSSLTTWIPNRKKTSHPIVLYGAANVIAIHSAAAQIKGLHTCAAGTPSNRVIILGWNRREVWLRASTVHASSSSEDMHRVCTTAQRLGNAMAREYIGLRLGKAENWRQDTLRGVLDHFQGSYLVRWRNVDGGWDVRGVLGLEIGSGPRSDMLEGRLEWNGVKETVLLAREAGVLDAWVEESERGEGCAGDRGGGHAADSGETKQVEKREEDEDSAPAEPDTTDTINSVSDEHIHNLPRGTAGNPREFDFVAELCYRVVGRAFEGCEGRLHWTGDETFTSFTGSGFLPNLSGKVEMEGWEI